MPSSGSALENLSFSFLANSPNLARIWQFKQQADIFYPIKKNDAFCPVSPCWVCSSEFSRWGSQLLGTEFVEAVSIRPTLRDINLKDERVKMTTTLRSAWLSWLSRTLVSITQPDTGQQLLSPTEALCWIFMSIWKGVWLSAQHINYKHIVRVLDLID